MVNPAENSLENKTPEDKEEYVSGRTYHEREPHRC